MLEPSYTPDLANEIDTPAEELAETLGISVSTAERVIVWAVAVQRKNEQEQAAMMISRIVGQLCGQGVNLPAMVYSLALAAGLDSLNEVGTQTEVAQRLKCSRALISHYVTSWSDLLGLKISKFRKCDSTRETYRTAAKLAWETRPRTNKRRKKQHVITINTK